MVDDNIVIGLRGNRIKSYHGATIELLPFSVTWYEVGDTIEVVEVGEGRRSEYKITAMEPQKGFYQPVVLTLDRPVEGTIVTMAKDDPGTFTSLVFNKSWRLDGTVIRGNVFQNTRRYAVLMGAGGVTIENNVMSNHTRAAILVSGRATFQNEQGALIYYFSSDVVIRNNTIVNAFDYGLPREGGPIFKRPRGAIELIDNAPEGIDIGEARLRTRISILDNLIVNSGSAGISTMNSSDVTMSGNTILFPNQKPQEKNYGITIEASDVTLSKNVFLGPKIDEDVHHRP